MHAVSQFKTQSYIQMPKVPKQSSQGANTWTILAVWLKTIQTWCQMDCVSA